MKLRVVMSNNVSLESVNAQAVISYELWYELTWATYMLLLYGCGQWTSTEVQIMISSVIMLFKKPLPLRTDCGIDFTDQWTCTRVQIVISSLLELWLETSEPEKRFWNRCLWSVNVYGSTDCYQGLVWSMIRNQWTLGKIVESMYVISEPVRTYRLWSKARLSYD